VAARKMSNRRGVPLQCVIILISVISGDTILVFLLRPTTFLGNQRLAQLLFQSSNELCISQWPPRSFMLTQGFILLIRYPTRKKSRPVIYNFQQWGHNHKHIVTSLDMGRRTTPGIFSWACRQLCSDWTQFNISPSRQQIMLIHHIRGKAPLPQMASPVLSEIYMPGITSMGFPDCPSKAFFRIRNGNKLNMVGHEAVGPNCNNTLGTPLNHKLYVDLIILLAEKGLLSAVSSLNYMMGVSRYHHSCHSGHIQIATLMNSSCQSKTSMVSPEF